MDCEHEADERLMQRAADGAREALSILLRRHATPLLTFIQRMIGDRHRAEEIFQEVFLAVWVQRRSYQYPSAFRPWLFGIAANKCRACLRWMRWTPPPAGDGAGVADVTRESSPPDAAIAAETAAAVAAAVAELPDMQRMVATLRIWNGLSYAEIAEVAKRSESTVRSNMFHALATLRLCLARRLNPREGA